MDRPHGQLSYTEITERIKVTVFPQFLREDSDREGEQFAFSYTVSIENGGEHRVQLLRRHWVITSGGSPFTEVKGEGVVGEQPLLAPGERFEYTSWAVIKDEEGTMQGSYTFRRQDGQLFEVAIPRFDLVADLTIH